MTVAKLASIACRAGTLARFNGHALVADVVAGATFKDGIRITGDQTTTINEEGRRLLSVRPRSTTSDNSSVHMLPRT